MPPQIWPQRRQCCNSCHGFATARPSLKFGFVFFLCQTVLNHRDIKDGGVCSNVRFSFVFTLTRVAEVAREQGWPPPKSLYSDENFKPEHTLFCCELRFVAIYALFLRSLGKKSAFLGQKQCFLGKKCTITWYILYISLS